MKWLALEDFRRRIERRSKHRENRSDEGVHFRKRSPKCRRPGGTRGERRSVGLLADRHAALQIGANHWAEDLDAIWARAPLCAEDLVELVQHDVEERLVLEGAHQRRHAHFLDQRAKPGEAVERGTHGLLDLGIEVAKREIADQPDAHASDAGFEPARVVLGHGLEHESAVAHRAGERTHSVEAERAGKAPAHGNAPGRRPDANDASAGRECGWTRRRQCPRRQSDAGGHRSRRAAG
jgi:hypothetical protein